MLNGLLFGHAVADIEKAGLGTQGEGEDQQDKCQKSLVHDLTPVNFAGQYNGLGRPAKPYFWIGQTLLSDRGK
jgi:hypothetical protein